MTYCIYGIAFFLITLLIQYLLRNYNNHGRKLTLWTGTGCVIIICIIGLLQADLNYYAAAIGFAIADQIGIRVGWHGNG